MATITNYFIYIGTSHSYIIRPVLYTALFASQNYILTLGCTLVLFSGIWKILWCFTVDAHPELIRGVKRMYLRARSLILCHNKDCCL